MSKINCALQDLNCFIVKSGGKADDGITVSDIMTTLIDHTKEKHSRRDAQERHRMRRLLNATSTRVNTYKHQGSHEETQVSKSEAVK